MQLGKDSVLSPLFFSFSFLLKPFFFSGAEKGHRFGAGLQNLYFTTAAEGSLDAKENKIRCRQGIHLIIRLQPTR